MDKAVYQCKKCDREYSVKWPYDNCPYCEVERLQEQDKVHWKTRRSLLTKVERLQRYPEAIAHVRAWYPEDVFLDSNGAARMARLTCDNIERLVREAAEAAKQQIETTDTPHDAV